MKKNRLTGLSIFLIIAISAILIFQNTNSEFFDEGISLSGNYKINNESSQVIRDVEVMEETLLDYFGEDQVDKVNQGTLAFLRKDRYGYNLSSLTRYIWSSYAGALETEVQLSKDENRELYSEMEAIVEGLGNFFEPKIKGDSESIDFIHMVVVVDMELTKVSEVDYEDDYYDYLFSWGGDLETFMEDVAKHFGKQEPSKEEIYEYAFELLGSDQSHFSNEDLLADIDGVNLASMMEEGMLFSTALKTYYEGGLFVNRYDLFLDSFIESATNGEASELDKVQVFTEKVEAVALGKIESSLSDQEDAVEFYQEFDSLKSLMQMYVFDTDTTISEEIRESVTQVFIDKIVSK